MTILISFLLLSSLPSISFGALSPPDPHTYPKFQLSFLNDLPPVEASTAHRWLTSPLLDDPSSDREPTQGTDGEGEPGRLRSVAVWYGQPEQDRDQQLTSERRLGLEEATAGVENTNDSSIDLSSYTLKKMKLQTRNYICLIPPLPSIASLPPPPPPPPMDPSLPAQLLDHLEGTCLYVRLSSASRVP
jgi:hypothetical protein